MSVEIKASLPDGTPLGAWRTDEDGSRAEVTALHWRWLDIRRAQDVPDPQFLLQQLQAWGAPWLVEPSDEEPATDDAVTERR